MPKQFLGDRLLSYAGIFQFSIETLECKTELDHFTLKNFPLLRIYSHDAIMLDYFGVSPSCYSPLKVMRVLNLFFIFEAGSI